MKNLLLILMIALLGLASCSKHTDLENAQEQVLDIYKTGKADVTIYYTNDWKESRILQKGQEVRFYKSEVDSIKVTALEDNTSLRLNGSITYLFLNKSKVYTFTK